MLRVVTVIIWAVAYLWGKDNASTNDMTITKNVERKASVWWPKRIKEVFTRVSGDQIEQNSRFRNKNIFNFTKCFAPFPPKKTVFSNTPVDLGCFRTHCF